MGLHDDAEMLAAAQAQSVLDEREIARLKAELNAAEQLIAEQARRLQEQTTTIFQAGEQAGILWRERHTLERQLDAVRDLIAQRTMNLRDSEDAHYDVVETDGILRIIGAQPAVASDEHDRTA